MDDSKLEMTYKARKTFVFPMAGDSRRFFDAGYVRPKFQLPVNAMPVFDHVLGSFSRYFSGASFVFITRRDYQGPEFVAKRLECLGIEDFRIVSLEHRTEGQADTVFQGLEKIAFDPNRSLTIFNIDTVRPNYVMPDTTEFRDADGFLETFSAPGDRWSFVVPFEGSNQVALTAEKRRVSDYCSTGLYHFKRYQDFCSALSYARSTTLKTELYVAPLYNYLIEQGRKILWYEVPSAEVVQVGTPHDYQLFCRQIARATVRECAV